MVMFVVTVLIWVVLSVIEAVLVGPGPALLVVGSFIGGLSAGAFLRGRR